MRENVSEQVHDQLRNINRTLEDLMGMTVQSQVLLKQDTTIIEILETPAKYSLLERYRIIKSKFESINNSFFMSTPPIYFTILDMHGNVYTSYQTKKTNDYNQIVKESWFLDLMNDSSYYRWVITDKNFVHPDFSKSSYLLSLDSKIKGRDNNILGIARVSIDFSAWFNKVLKALPVHQDYFIVGENGKIIDQSNKAAILPNSTIKLIKANTGLEGYFDSKDTSYIINYNYIDALGWHIVNRIPLDIMYDEINEIKMNYFITFIVLLLVFIIIMIFITTKFTNPLKELQKKMKEVVRGNLNTSIPEHRYSGEILALTQHFNKMVRDLDHLIEQLKIEERQKESIKFKMLLTQMNPHFLNNTLNTVKFIALREKNDDITEICISLGKILETSLNSDIELIRLSEELDLLTSYIYIQNYRYKGKFKLVVDYDDHLNDALVPKLSLQPIIENSIYHGFLSRNTGRINIRIFEKSYQLNIEITDDGIGMAEAAKQNSKGSGIGLVNLKERLHILFKGENGFSISSSASGTKVKLFFPLLISKKYQ